MLFLSAAAIEGGNVGFWELEPFDFFRVLKDSVASDPSQSLAQRGFPKEVCHYEEAERSCGNVKLNEVLGCTKAEAQEVK
jgi:hypothetical protein